MFTRNLTHTSSSDISAQSSVENPFHPEEEHERLIPNSHNDLQNSYPHSYQNSYQNGDSRYQNSYQNGDSRYPGGYQNGDSRYPSGYPSSGSGSSESPDFNHASSSGSLLPPQRPDHQRWSASPSITYDPDSSPFGGYPAHQFPLSIEDKEPDDYLHNPDPVADAEYDKNRFWYDLKTMDTKSRNAAIALVGMVLAAVAVFVLIPVFTYSGVGAKVVPQRYEVLTLYQYPLMGGLRTSLIDPDTPQEYLTKKARDGSDWTLVFSDEFNAEGRTFYDGDDQFWQAVDLHYDATKDLEWYDPDAVTTAEGTLNLRMDAFKNHDMFYRSGMVQSWNKMCFTQGHIEISARLPNYGNVSGLWPGLWTMGNLGRPGYLATTDGVWPYTYESCDAGITANQSSPDGISFLPGQRLNSCTCKGESHPNPGTGRGAPEIDILEGEIHEENGRVSQSYQVAPYDIWYMPDYEFVEIHNKSVTVMNTYAGGPFQQAISAVTRLNRSWYEFGDGPHNFQTYAFEYLHDNDDGYITWFVGQDPTMTMRAKALHPDGNVGWRRISKEPMSVIMNLGISNNWAYIDWNGLNFPATHRIDYVRIYQPKDQINTGCDPTDHPTQNYIQAHPDIYSNVNLTSFTKAGYPWPKNSLLGCD